MYFGRKKNCLSNTNTNLKVSHIILSLLLLSSPLFGQTEETIILFHREENGKYGWYENGDEYDDRKYVGEIEKLLFSIATIN